MPGLLDRLLGAFAPSRPAGQVAISRGNASPAPPLLMVVTGAGVSAQSGLPTYRGAGGLYGADGTREPATAAAFSRDPAKVARSYEARRAEAARAEPNAAHLALADLERRHRGEFLLVTTNVDSLHEAAGSRRVLHLHGRLDRVRCPACGGVTVDADGGLVDRACAACGHRGPHRPDATLFGERPLHLDRAFAATDRCSVFLAVGCGGAVRPANLLPKMASRNHLRDHRLGEAPCRTVEINPVPTGDPAFREIVAATAAEAVPAWVEAFLAGPPVRD